MVDGDGLVPAEGAGKAWRAIAADRDVGRIIGSCRGVRPATVPSASAPCFSCSAVAFAVFALLGQVGPLLFLFRAFLACRYGLPCGTMALNHISQALKKTFCADRAFLAGNATVGCTSDKGSCPPCRRPRRAGSRGAPLGSEAEANGSNAASAHAADAGTKEAPNGSNAAKAPMRSKTARGGQQTGGSRPVNAGESADAPGQENKNPG
jgi:hypothetical protein